MIVNVFVTMIFTLSLDRDDQQRVKKKLDHLTIKQEQDRQYTCNTNTHTHTLSEVQMAYISKEKTAEIRANLKQEFPEMRFGVRRDNYGCLHVSIFKSPYEFRNEQQVRMGGSFPVNHYYPAQWNHADILQRIIDICNDGNWNNSQPEVDYFNVGWYLSLQLGNWKTHFERTYLTPAQQTKLMIEHHDRYLAYTCTADEVDALHI